MTNKVTGSITIKKGRPNYYIVLCYKDADGKYKRPTINTEIPIKGNNKRLANERLQEVLAERNAQKVDLSKDVLFTDFINNWLETRKITKTIQPTTYDSYKLTLKTHVLPYFEKLGLKVRAIEPKHIQAYVNAKMKQGLSVNTVKKHLANITACLESAVKQNIIAFNPATRIEKLKKEKFTAAKYLNEAEIELLLTYFEGDPLDSIVRIALFYGLRRSEILGLKYGAIDFDNNTISIEHTVVHVTETHCKDITKNASSKDILPLPNVLKVRLIAWKEEQAQRKALQPNSYVDSDYVCTMFDGQLMKPDYITKHFKLILRKNNFPDMRFHDLRHSSATFLKYLGFDLKDIQTWLRHADIQTSMNLYTHMDMTAKQGISDKLEERNAENGFVTIFVDGFVDNAHF